jgi:nifR3 family TIM-barrel protein
MELLDSRPEEKPFSVQIFGSDPSIMAEAAKIVESSGADIVDINLGCSVRKIIKTGAGVALMRTPEKAEAIFKQIRKSIRIPLTVKMRSGWEKSGEQALRIAKISECCGVDAVSIHPRTASQGFNGKADWSIISAVKNAVKIPVIGNGDILAPEDALAMKDLTACDAVMIGRAAIGAPWIFSQVIALINGCTIPAVDLAHRSNIMNRYVKASVRHLGEKRASLMMRSRLGWFVKCLPRNSRFRESIKRISCEQEALELIDAYFARIDETHLS